MSEVCDGENIGRSRKLVAPAFVGQSLPWSACNRDEISFPNEKNIFTCEFHPGIKREIKPLVENENIHIHRIYLLISQLLKISIIKRSKYI